MSASHFVAVGALLTAAVTHFGCPTGGDGEPSEHGDVPDASHGAFPDAAIDAQMDPCANVVLNPTCDEFFPVTPPLPGGGCPSGSCLVVPTIPDTQCLKQHWPNCCSAGGYPYYGGPCDAGAIVDATGDGTS
jgi:hypothetical protein